MVNNAIGDTSFFRRKSKPSFIDRTDGIVNVGYLNVINGVSGVGYVNEIYSSSINLLFYLLMYKYM